MNKYLKLLSGLPAYAAMGAVCLVGLMKTSSEMNQQTLWFIYCVLAVLGCAVVVWLFNMRKITPGVVDIAAAGLLAWYAACYYIHDSIAVSQMLETSFFAALYLSLRILLSSFRNSGKWLLVMLCVCGFIEAYTGIQQAFGARYSNHSLFSVTGTFFNPGPYGGYLAIVLSLALGYVASKSRYTTTAFRNFKLNFRKIGWMLVFAIAGCTVIAIVIILPSTLSRAAFVAVAVAGVAIVLADRKIYEPILDYTKQHKTRTRIIAILTILLIPGITYGIYTLKKDSADGRLLMWKTAAKIMTENPATGVGQGYYRGAYGDVQAEYFRTAERSQTEIKVAGCPDYGFNEYLHIGAETGVPGLLLFIFLIGAAAWKLFRARSYYAFGLLSLLVFAFFSYPFGILPIKILFVLFLAVAGSCAQKQRKATTIERAAVGVALCGCVGIAVLLPKPYIERIEATQTWQEQRQWYLREFYSYVLEDAPKLFPLMKENPIFLFEYGRSLSNESHYQESLDILIPATRLSCDPMYHNIIGNNYKALGQYDKAAEAYLKAYYIIPHRMYPLFLLGTMYSQNGETKNARHYATRVVEMIPKIESSATRDMQQKMKDVLEKINNDEKK